MNEHVEIALEASKRAGEEILKHYRQVVLTEKKQDGSPVTIADKRSHQALSQILSGTALPIVSEEGDELFPQANEYWLVDPLDGTKDFIAQNGEFTVNIAQMRNGLPVLGVVSALALGETYLGIASIGSWRINQSGQEPLSKTGRDEQTRIATSRFHDHPAVESFARLNQIKNKIMIGSALKYCYLASDRAEVFPRLVGSSEWDTAAGQVILESVGGKVLYWSSCKRLEYGKAKRRNGALLGFRSPYGVVDFSNAPLENLE